MAEVEQERPSQELLISSQDVPDSTEEQNKCCSYATTIYKNDKFKLVTSLFLGQGLSLLLCGTGVFSQLLETNHSIAVPTTQSFINYVLLAAVFGSALAVKKDFLKILWKNWWKYIILGVIDVEANYMVVRAYQYTNLTTIQLLDSFTIACVMVLSFFFLRVRYKLINLMGISLSLIGIVCIVLATVIGSPNTSGPNPLLGDLLCLGGSALYAVSNVAQEFLVKNHSIVEFLGLLGFSSSVVSGIQLIVLDRESLARIEWTYEIGLLFFGFGLCMFLFYSLMPHVMKVSSAVVVNLSLLTSDVYTFLFGLFLFHLEFSFFYIVALVLVITGVFIYNIRLPRVAKKTTKTNNSKTKTSSRPAEPHEASYKEIESSLDERKRPNLRDLLESSNFEYSTADSMKQSTEKKRLHQCDSSSFSPTVTSEASPLAQSMPPTLKGRASSVSSTASGSYGSVAQPGNITSSSSVSSGSTESQKPLRTSKPGRTSKSQLISATQHPTE